MAHFNFNQKKKEDKIVYGDGIVDGIILLAVSELSKVILCDKKASRKKKHSSIKVAFSKDGLDIDVYVKIHFSQSVSDTAFKIQETIRHNIESMTDYHINSVNVNVVGVFFEDKPTTPTTDTQKTEENTNTTENQTKETNKN